ncbi:conserved protein of unknown function (plasmid) [Rhodovastum atsumiense]|uniref:HK97 gp10 family phage protein n=1 Tax=Rhodovastum atsumiense TaxID=504468 RepID=A0A5M6IWN5_9PROT|nr:phage virion morphogenesis protein [Rhodovastum atsumiense]KAA5611878.1 hypothetical protein F1189_12665 [Rhodovastum atsumiense]CAH2606142.1 conserved protein of unknown function [Rhodovastum atsumiense]
MRTFRDMDSFVKQFSSVPRRVTTAQARALDRCARLLEKDIKGQFGHYQPSIGELLAWKPLAEATMEERKARGYAPNEPLLAGGELRDSVSHQSDASRAIVGSTLEYARWIENGTFRTPPRPTFGRTAIGKAKDVAKIIGDATTKEIGGDRQL